MSKAFGRRWRLLALTAGAVVAVSVGVAYAAIPGSNGVISGCYGGGNGQLRVIDAEDGETCKKNETALDWNKEGPAGEPGVSGYEVFTITQDFGPGGIGGAWCGAPAANTEDTGWRVVSGGAQLTSADIDAGVAVASSWPNLVDPNNPGWNVQLNKPANVDPGVVNLYAVCVKVAS